MLPISGPSHLNPVEETADCLLQDAQAHGIVIVRFEPALGLVVPVVKVGLIELQPHTRSTHSENNQFEPRWHWIVRFDKAFIEPLAMPCKHLVHFLFFLLRHRLKRREATSFDGVEAQGVADQIEVADDLIAAADALGNDAGKGLPKEAWAMADKCKPVEKDLHDAGDIESIVRRGEDDTIRRHHFLDEHIPVVLQETRLLTLRKALLTPSTGPKVIITEDDDLVLDITQRL